MIYKVETPRGFEPYEFADAQSAKDYVMGFLSWSGTRYRIVKARQTWKTEELVSTKDLHDGTDRETE